MSGERERPATSVAGQRRADEREQRADINVAREPERGAINAAREPERANAGAASSKTLLLR